MIVYRTETELGIAIKESGVSRDKLFITTKVHHNVGDIENGLKTSLKKLQLDYVDLYAPSPTAYISHPWLMCHQISYPRTMDPPFEIRSRSPICMGCYGICSGCGIDKIHRRVQLPTPASWSLVENGQGYTSMQSDWVPSISSAYSTSRVQQATWHCNDGIWTPFGHYKRSAWTGGRLSCEPSEEVCRQWSGNLPEMVYRSGCCTYYYECMLFCLPLDEFTSVSTTDVLTHF